MPDQLDPNPPLPRWRPRPGAERDPERIEVLLAQVARVWKRNPELRLCQLLVNLLDPEPNRLFYLEDHGEHPRRPGLPEPAVQCFLER